MANDAVQKSPETSGLGSYNVAVLMAKDVMNRHRRCIWCCSGDTFACSWMHAIPHDRYTGSSKLVNHYSRDHVGARRYTHK